MRSLVLLTVNVLGIPLLGFMVRRAVAAWRNPVAFERQVRSLQRIQRITPETALARVSLSWMVMVGFLLMFIGQAPVSLWRVATGASTEQILGHVLWFTGPLVLIGVLMVLAFPWCGWWYWPRWTVPPHQRDQPSPHRRRKAKPAA